MGHRPARLPRRRAQRLGEVLLVRIAARHQRPDHRSGYPDGDHQQPQGRRPIAAKQTQRGQAAARRHRPAEFGHALAERLGCPLSAHVYRIRGFKYATRISVARFTTVKLTAITATMARTTGKSREWIACTESQPTPGQAKIVSVTTEPPSRTPSWSPITVTTGSAALARA